MPSIVSLRSWLKKALPDGPSKPSLCPPPYRSGSDPVGRQRPRRNFSGTWSARRRRGSRGRAGRAAAGSSSTGSRSARRVATDRDLTYWFARARLLYRRRLVRGDQEWALGIGLEVVAEVGAAELAIDVVDHAGLVRAWIVGAAGIIRETRASTVAASDMLKKATGVWPGASAPMPVMGAAAGVASCAAAVPAIPIVAAVAAVAAAADEATAAPEPFKKRRRLIDVRFVADSGVIWVARNRRADSLSPPNLADRSGRQCKPAGRRAPMTKTRHGFGIR